MGRGVDVAELSGKQIREKRWARVRRVAAWQGKFFRRHPMAAGAMNLVVRRGLVAYARAELPRGVGLLEAGIAAMPDAWERDGERECRGIWHGYRLRLELSDYYQRFAHYLGRYHEVPLQLLVRRALREGDTLIDGGANNGLVSLVAAWRVGPEGRVFAMEPNPRVYERLRWHVECNGLAHVRALQTGLSDRDEELELCVPGRDNLGAGTCAPLPERYGGEVQHRCMVRLVRADACAEIAVRGELMVKLDIEGFELRALRGMAALIERNRPLVVSELNVEMLRRAGTTGREVMEFMASRGYRAFEFGAMRAVVRVRRLTLREIDPARDELPFDVAWVHPQSAMWARLRACMNAL